MTSARLSYSIVTPARDERENVERLAASLIAQTLPPAEWIIVDACSSDGTAAVVEELRGRAPWIRLVTIDREAGATRGAPIARSFATGVGQLGTRPDVVVKLDADVSMEPDYFERLLAAFAADGSLGIASGSAYEREDGTWRQRFMTRTSVWGACRAYRRACLEDVMPLEQRMGWDSVDEFRANVRGWRTRTLLDLPFRHHRPEGQREGSRRRAWVVQGSLAHYLRYRPSYLLIRALYQSVRDPAAIALLVGYVRAAIAREPRCEDLEASRYLREQQALRRLPRRVGEALGLRSG